MARCRHNGANDWQSQTRVWCARKGAAQFVATMNEGREWECCNCLQCAHEMCEWVVACGIWMASQTWFVANGFVCVEVRTNSWQSVELRVGFTTLVAVASSILCQRNDGAQLSSLNWDLSRWHQLTIHMNENCENGETWWNDDFQRRKGWGEWMICYDFYCRFDTTTSSLSIYQRLRCFEVWR